MIVKNKLLNFTDKIIYQDTEWFNFSLDSVLLANFVNTNDKTSTIVDLATGNAPIPMLLTYKTKAKIYGIEIQPEVYELAFKSVEENKFTDRIILINDDIKNIKNHFINESADIVTCNPPYFQKDTNKLRNNNYIKSVARHEILITFEELLNSVCYILKNKGSFYLIHRTSRLVEIIENLKKYNLEPKKIQFIYAKNSKGSELFLIEAVKNGGSDLKVLPPIIVHDDNNEYTKEIKSLFQEKR